MIPLKDDNPKKNLPFVNFIFIIVNIAVFIYQPSSEQLLRAFFNTYGLIPNKLVTVLQNELPQIILISKSLFSSLFVHADFLHLAGNMIFLWVFGDNIEYGIGHFNYIIFYVLCGIAATLVQVFIEPNSSNSNYRCQWSNFRCSWTLI